MSTKVSSIVSDIYNSQTPRWGLGLTSSILFFTQVSVHVVCVSQPSACWPALPTMSHVNSPTYALSWRWSWSLHVSRCVHRAQKRPSLPRVLRIVPTNWVMLHVFVVVCIPFTCLSLSWVRLLASLPPAFIFPIRQLAPAMKRNSRNCLAIVLTC